MNIPESDEKKLPFITVNNFALGENVCKRIKNKAVFIEMLVIVDN